MTDHYVEYPPPAGLRAQVECFWSRTTSSHALDVTRVLPDGCVDIVLGFNGTLAFAQAVGTMTRPLVVRDREHTSIAGVRFRAGYARVVFGLPASELTDLRVPLEEVWPDAGPLLEDLAPLSGALPAVVALRRVLEERLKGVSAAPRDVNVAIERVVLAQGNLRIGALGPTLGLTRQHLARQFAEHVGVSPKMFARVVRLRSLLARIRNADEVEWSALALSLGFFDQSHLIDDFRALTGLPPSRWLRGG
jgi:AraC-like DNA-binding protein